MLYHTWSAVINYTKLKWHKLFINQKYCATIWLINLNCLISLLQKMGHLYLWPEHIYQKITPAVCTCFTIQLLMWYILVHQFLLAINYLRKKLFMQSFDLGSIWNSFLILGHYLLWVYFTSMLCKQVKLIFFYWKVKLQL